MYVVAYGRAHAWPNLRETFRVCWGEVGDSPRPKQIQNFSNWIFLWRIFFCLQPNSDLCTRDNSIGFEDCHLATHLLNFYLIPITSKFSTKSAEITQLLVRRHSASKTAAPECHCNLSTFQSSSRRRPSPPRGCAAPTAPRSPPPSPRSPSSTLCTRPVRPPQRPTEVSFLSNR